MFFYVAVRSIDLYCTPLTRRLLLGADSDTPTLDFVYPTWTEIMEPNLRHKGHMV